jgi:hypothetical protein
LIGLDSADGGSLPTELGYLTALFFVLVDLLGKNVFQGSIPTEIGALTAMQFLFLGMNLLEGQLSDIEGDRADLTPFCWHMLTVFTKDYLYSTLIE